MHHGMLVPTTTKKNNLTESNSKYIETEYNLEEHQEKLNTKANAKL